jgi:thiamine biosynthesis lipoprotein
MQAGMTRQSRHLLSFFVALLVVGLTAFFSVRRLQEYSSEQFLMDTLVSIKVYGDDPATLKAAVAAAYGEMSRISDLVDRFPQSGTADCQRSDVCRINESAGIKAVHVDADTLAMLLLAKKYHDLSAGAFDVTIGPVMDLWGFAESNPRVPAPHRIVESLALVDNQSFVVNIQEQTVSLQRVGMKLDLGALAKGYATEKALQILEKHGIKKALIDAGGNIRVLGTNARNTPWRIGIKDPRKGDALAAILPLQDTAAVTSGDYYRYFEANGKRYHHILDPRSGYPASENMTVTVVSKDAGLADVLSTTFFVLKGEQAVALAEKLGVELFLVNADGRILHTPGLTGCIDVMSGSGLRYDPRR